MPSNRKRKGKKKGRDADSPLPIVAPTANSSKLASTEPTDELSPRRQWKTRDDKKTQDREDALDSTLKANNAVLALVAEAAARAPLEIVRTAALLALKIVETCQAVEENDHLYRLMAADATQLIAIIWWSYKQSPTPKAWLTPNLQQVVQELVRSLTDIDGFVKALKNQGVFIRILASPAEVSRIKAYRDCINTAVERFEIFAHRKLADMLNEVCNNQNETKRDLMDGGVVAVDAVDDRVLGIQVFTDDVSATMVQADQPLSPPGHVSPQMFPYASNLAISGGNFVIKSQTIVHGSDDEARLKIVYNTAAPNAILNAGGRADEVRCHPGTREEVLAKSETWMDPPPDQQIDDSRKRIFWLSGPAGAGKSAIVQTLAERRLDLGLPMANFFFYRNDSTRSSARPLVATLLVQLFKLYPELKPLLAAVLADNPLIISQSLHDQFQQLIDIPIRAIRAANPSLMQQPIILLIDGLDECSSAAKHEQRSLLKVLHGLVSRQDTPFLVFVASRPEPHLTMTFNEVGSSMDSIFLNKDYHPQHDIRLFVVAELAKIRRNHHLGPTLPHDWPTNDQIKLIVNKSSGQFIFAATVMRFIAGSAASPAISLEKIQGLRPANRSSPFAELDAIYIHILSQVDDWKSTRDILTAEIIRQAQTPSLHLNSYLRQDDHASFVSELTAIVKFNDWGNLEFYHASLTDFLHDKTRSGAYHINVQEFCDTWAPRFVGCIRDDDSLLVCRKILEQISGPSLSITKALLSFPTLGSQFAHEGWVTPVFFMGLTLREYCREDDLLHKQLVQLWITWFRKCGVIFEDPNLDDKLTTYLQTIKAQLEPGVWEEVIRSSKAETKSRRRF